MMSQRKVGAMAAAVSSNKEEEMMELRRGPWTLEEDNLLMNYIACHGEGRWNLLARCSGLKRTGKSCRLRWLNYLKPDIKRGNLTPEEQLLILELHSKWGNRWSRIAQHLPGRTDNEIKNYWRTRVQKQARQLRVDANSPVFRDAVRCYWMPRLLEKMAASSTSPTHYMDPAAAALLHPASIVGGGGVVTASSSSPVHHGSHLHNAVSGGGYYHQNVVDPSPSTSTTSGSTTAAALTLPVPCFSELSHRVDQEYGGGPCSYYDLGGAPFDSSAAQLGSLGLDELDLGPTDCGGDYSDSTLLDYLNSTCTGAGAAAMTMMLGGGGGGNVVPNDDDGALYYAGGGGPTTTTWRTTGELCQAAAKWGRGGI